MIEEMNAVPPGTVAMVVLTDGRLHPMQKSFTSSWLEIGHTRTVTPEELMDVVNIQNINLHREGIQDEG
jgi:hypothetical protein